MKGTFNKLILFLISGGLSLALFLFLIGWFQVHWTFQALGLEYGFVAEKSQVFCIFSTTRREIGFLSYIAFGMLAIGGILGLWRCSGYNSIRSNTSK